MEFKRKCRLYRYKNPIYFNYNQEPVQALDFTQVIKAELEKDFKLKK